MRLAENNICATELSSVDIYGLRELHSSFREESSAVCGEFILNFGTFRRPGKGGQSTNSKTPTDKEMLTRALEKFFMDGNDISKVRELKIASKQLRLIKYQEIFTRCRKKLKQIKTI